MLESALVAQGWVYSQQPIRSECGQSGDEKRDHGGHVQIEFEIKSRQLEAEVCDGQIDEAS